MMRKDPKQLSDEELKRKYHNWGQANDLQPLSAERLIKRNALKTMQDMVEDPIPPSNPKDERLANFIAVGSACVTAGIIWLGSQLIQCSNDKPESQPDTRTKTEIETKAVPAPVKNIPSYQKFTS